jgi:hypothetical protein
VIRTRPTVVVASCALSVAAIGGVAVGVAKVKGPVVCASKHGGSLYSAHKCQAGDHKLVLPAGPRARAASAVRLARAARPVPLMLPPP